MAILKFCLPFIISQRCIVIAILIISVFSMTVRAGFAASDPLSGIIQFETRTKENPQDFLSLTILAQLYARQAKSSGDLSFYPRALTALDQALKIKADHVPAILARASILYALHRFSEAETLARGILKQEPNNEEALAVLSDSNLELGNYVEAKENIKKLQELAADEPSVMARAAKMIELEGNCDAAAELLLGAEKAMSKLGDFEEQHAWYQIRIGELAFRRGDLVSAEMWYARALKMVPDNFSAREHLAEVNAANERYELAIAIYKKLIEKTPRPEFYQHLGDLYAYMGKTDEAKSWLGKAEQGYLDSAKAGEVLYFHHLATLYSDSLPNPEKALSWSQKDFELRKSAAAYDQLAWAYYKNLSYEKSFTEINHALESIAGAQQDPHILFHAAMIYSATGKIRESKDFLKKVAILNPAYNKFHVHR